MLDLEISGDAVSEQIELQLVNLKAAATKENMTLEEAARHLLSMRDAHSESQCDRSFNKREYIKQRFGVDPETAAPDSFVGMLYQDTHRGTQLGELRHKVVLETSTLALEEFVFNGTGTDLTADEYTQAQERINSRIDNDFFAKVNWGEGSHPLLVGTSAQQPKQLKSSQTKTGQSPKK
ncbi:MAG: hypothetical protein HC903_06335 [Methylacidiphilales bacterium]|nr:hypothetical protein [Candidatus Methylacidiphilales bacterium]NJR19945.1 hypothetical protein [Calothrix sp. CSU_2_0]